MKRKICSCCGQPLAEYRLGIRLTPLKARIFDAIKRRGSERIQAREIGNPITVKSHVWQINDLLEETDITPDQITDYKVNYHRTFLQRWLVLHPEIPFTLQEYWRIREACITALS